MSLPSEHDSGHLIPLDAEPGAAPLPADSGLPVFALDSAEPLQPEWLLGGPPPTGTPQAPTPLPAGPDHVGDGPSAGTPRKGIWRSGDVLMCACPDCRAPMSIRLWLMVADCWQCGLSIELTEEQEREARRLMAAAPQPAGTKATGSPAANGPANGRSPGSRRTRGAIPAATSPVAPAAPARTPAARRPPAESRPAPGNAPAQPSRRPAARQDSPAGRRPDDTASSPRRRQAASRTRARLRQTRRRGVTAWLSDAIGMTPAWLISLIFHLIVLTLMALFLIGEEQEDPYITLSTTVSKDVFAGGDTMVVDPTNELAFDLPLPRDLDVDDKVQREAIIKANQDAKELRVDPETPNMPDIRQVKQLVGGKTGISSALAARDPRIRVEMVKREGGTTLSEAAVARGLRWLARHQSADGSWSLDRFNRSSGCTCTATGIRSHAAGTSLALLPFLGAGQTHLVGHYQEAVARGLRWLITHQKENGDLRADSSGNAGMYAQGQCAIVLCEAFFMTGDEELRVPAQRAIDFIVEAQHGAGGWRYRPGEAGDTSVFGWQLMALQSARAANLTVPPETLTLASHYLDAVQHNDGAQYSYQRGRRPDHVMSAEGLLCRMYLGWTHEDPGLQRGIDLLARDHLPDKAAPNLYYWYYATQAFHHLGGSSWDRWNRQMRTILVETQRKRGHAAGSWDPPHQHDRSGGRVYATALATCTLEVYYRHLPIFRQIELE